MAAELTVIIPTLNRVDLLGDCLDSLAKQDATDFDIVVVDDGSEEDVSGFLAEKYPNVRCVRLPKNGGFAAAVNAGLAELSTTWVFLLNNDMTLREDCITKLLAGAKAAGAEMAAPLVVWKDDPDVIYSTGDSQGLNGRPESVGFRCALDGFVKPEEIFGVSAGAGLYRSEIFEKIGTFDERFGAYFEDSDFNFRARWAGFNAVFVREAVASHIGSASLQGRTWWRSRQCFRNHTLLVLKNMPWSFLLSGAVLGEVFHQMRQAFSAIRTEVGALRAAASTVGVMLEIIALCPHVLRERARITASRKISVDKLRSMLRP